MSCEILKYLRLSDGDLGFLVNIASPEVTNKPKLKQIIREDEDFINSVTVQVATKAPRHKG